MDFNKYWRFENGIYSVHFLNKAKLTETEIRNIFSNYGKILNINGKDENGLRFITYKTLPEVISCVKGLWEDKSIKLLPEKSKMNSSNKYVNKTDLSQQQAVRTEKSFEKTINNGKYSNSNSIYDENSSNIEESWTPLRISSQNHESDNYQNSMHDHKPNLYANECNKIDSPVFNGNSSLPSKQQTSIEDNSPDIIDYAKYYRISKDGSFTVHFSNRKGITLEKTKELFASYGNVLAVYPGGANNGLTFIKYKTEEEVKKCIKGFQNNKEIFILPQKDKRDKVEIKNTDQKVYVNPWQVTEDTSEMIFDTGKQFNSNSIHNEKFSDYREKPSSDRDKYGSTENFSDISSCNLRQDWRSNANKIKHENINSQMINEKYSFLSQNPINNEDYNCIMREKQQETTFQPSIKTKIKTKLRNVQTSMPDYKMPALISDIDIKSRESDTMSESSLSNGNRNSSPKIVYIPMQEIIVANININYGIHYILHLFEKHNPISATLVKTIPETNIRYCHVYFKSMQDAVTVEEEFDNFDLSGKNLVVLRKSRLIDETM